MKSFWKYMIFYQKSGGKQLWAHLQKEERRKLYTCHLNFDMQDKYWKKYLESPIQNQEDELQPICIY